MKVELNPKEMQTNKADSRGRITLGAEYAGKEVTVIITDTDDD